MPNRTASITPEFQSLNDSLVQLEREPSFALALKTISTITSFLGIPTFGTERLYNVDKIKQNPGWFVSADGFADRRACYKLAEDNTQNLDIKVYWIQKTSKRIISSAVMFTPNFEDEPFNVDLKVGIDFFIPPSADRIIIALSNRYLIRTLELSGSLSLTQQEIFTKWIQKFDFSNKAQAHQVLWESLDLQPLNKQFYKEVTRFFTELIQHLETDTKLFQSKEAAQFTNRLVGRLIFCWFLRKKQIIADDRAYFEIDESIDSSAYYHNRLEKLFFSILNTKIEERNEEDKTTPFLNGGLFEAKQTDHRANKDLTFPKDYFHRFFEFLDGYNFTTDESTSEFQQVAIDPEMLGRIFENLLAEQTEETGQQARKAKGAFYTPREIVDYMCKESLREYVRTRLPDDNKRDHVLELLFDKKEHQFDYSNYRADIQPYKKNILDALDEITILDPACGSGAFPMGMLQLMLSIYERIDARFDSYKTKLGIVKNNLFGVDIEPMAVEISRLRAWLSIIVDVDMNPTKENLGIEPLPNLEFKFVAANSLIPLEAGGTEQMEFDNKNLQEEMSRIRDRYFNTNSGKVKEKMKLDYEKLLCSGNTMFKSDRQKKLLTYHPFDSSKSAGFFDPKLMFGLEGFDVVIGNPPYVSHDKILNKTSLKSYKSYSPFADLYCYFLEKSVDLLNKTGLMTLIVSNSFIKADYGIGLRQILGKQNTIKKMIDIQSSQIFESAIVNTAIIQVQKNGKDFIDRSQVTSHAWDEGSFDDFVRVNGFDVSPEVFSSSVWSLEHENIQKLIKKIQESGKTLEELKTFIRLGLATGANEAFVLNKDQYSSFKVNEKNLEVIKPVLRGRDIERYQYTAPSNWIILAKNDVNIKDKYPDLYKHLDSFGGKFKNRGAQGKKWWNLRACSFFEEFLKPKIIWIELSDTNRFALCDDEVYLLNSAYFLIPPTGINPEYLLGVLNSSLIRFFMSKIAATSGMGTLRWINAYVKQFPIVVNDTSPLITEIEKRVEDVIKKKAYGNQTDVLEKELDDLVMDLYQLTEEEKEIIRKS